MNGKIEGGNVGDVKAIALVNIPSYGWLECNGQSVLRTDYPLLFNYFNTQCYDDDPTHTLLEQYGYADSEHFNLPDYQEVALVGVGTNVIDKANGALATSDIYTVGQFKDDRIQDHNHLSQYGNNIGTNNAMLIISNTIGTAQGLYVSNARKGGTTRGKRKGVKFIIKVL